MLDQFFQNTATNALIRTFSRRKITEAHTLTTWHNLQQIIHYNAFNVYRRELAPGTVSLTGDRAQGDDSKHWAYSTRCFLLFLYLFTI